MSNMLTLVFPGPALRRAARGPLAAEIGHYDPVDVVAGHLRRAPPAEVGLVNAMRYLDLKLTLAGDILVKVDRASMAVSLEVRPVYLHRDIISLACRIPPAMLAGPRHSKGILKSALVPWLPAPLLYRKKMGFAIPLGRWIGADLDVGGGDPGPMDEVIDGSLLRELTAAHQNGKGDRTSLIHSLFFLGHWMRKWL
jgi:asparagine synthase (glutamine-hydrolysing)